MKSIAILASGSGTNAENLIRFFRTHPQARVKMVLSNRPGARVIEREQSYDIDTLVFDREGFYQTGTVLSAMEENGIDFIVLAGFLWLVPDSILERYENKIVNIHPALLPKFGGKGMYGSRVHEAVINSGEKVSGITIHRVNQQYDQGDILFQATCPVDPDETPDSLARKIHELEYTHFPRVVEQLLYQI